MQYTQMIATKQLLEVYYLHHLIHNLSDSMKLPCDVEVMEDQHEKALKYI